MLRTDRIWNGAWFWSAGNLLELLSLLIQLLPGYGVVRASQNYEMVLASLLMVSHLLRVLALSRSRVRRSAVLIGGGIIAAHGLFVWGFNGLNDMNIVSVCELACSDMGPDWEEPIELTAFADLIFVQADPVLLRLAVHNLIDDAQKHRASGHRIEVNIDRSTDLTALFIRVINWPAAPFAASSDLFGRGVRGSGASREGKGLGLYIVREIAGIHGGAVEAVIDPDGCTVFQISMPLDCVG